MKTDNERLVFGEKVEGLPYRERPAVYGLILNEVGQLAVVRVEGIYYLPGGGIEGRESEEACLIRECEEEMGCRVAVERFIGRAVQHLLSRKDSEPVTLLGSFYQCSILDYNGVKVEEDHELLWFPPEEAADLMFVEFQAWAIRQLPIYGGGVVG